MTEVVITRLGSGGDGVALAEGAEIFAPFTVPGERVSGTVVDGRMPRPAILEPSPDRVKAPCPHFRSCGGCATQHIRDTRLAAWKRDTVAAALARVGLTPAMPATITSPPASRRRASFAGRRTKTGTMIGFHQRGSDAIVPLRACPVVRPALLATFPVLDALTRFGASRKSVLRLQVTDSAAGPDVDVRGGKALTRGDDVTLAALAAGHGLARLSWEGETVVERAPPAQSFGRTRVVPPPGAFLQATAEGEAALLKEVRAIVGGAGAVVDLFSGCGTFALPLAERAAVHAVEGDAAMLAALDRGWRHGQGMRPVTTEVRDLFRNPLDADELARFGAAVIDPPRAGARAQIAALAASTVPVVAHVSCNPATFARDAKTLVAGGFTLSRVQVVDQFIWSPHIELVGHFTRT